MWKRHRTLHAGPFCIPVREKAVVTSRALAVLPVVPASWVVYKVAAVMRLGAEACRVEPASSLWVSRTGRLLLLGLLLALPVVPLLQPHWCRLPVLPSLFVGVRWRLSWLLSSSLFRRSLDLGFGNTSELLSLDLNVLLLLSWRPFFFFGVPQRLLINSEL